MEWWTRVRLEVSREGKKKREVLRDEGISWKTLKKILAYPEPPGYRLKELPPKPKIGSYLERIAQIIEEDKGLAKKQRHAGKLNAAQRYPSVFLLFGFNFRKVKAA